MSVSYLSLPDNLPVPENDGAADHLFGVAMPCVMLPATNGASIDLSSFIGRTVVYAYPKTGIPGEGLIDGWDTIPGARGCTPEACAFRDHYADLKDAGADRVFGLSTQNTAYQQDLQSRLHLPFDILSDEKLELARAISAPTFKAGEEILFKRFTLILMDAIIQHVFYPVFPPDKHAAEVLAWLKAHPRLQNA